jgi:hypothetical protein
MFERIKRLVKDWLCKWLCKSQPATPAVTPVAVPEMQPTNLTVNVGGTDYPVYHLHGSRKLPYIFSGNTFVPLSVFKRR